MNDNSVNVNKREENKVQAEKWQKKRSKNVNIAAEKYEVKWNEMRSFSAANNDVGLFIFQA